MLHRSVCCYAEKWVLDSEEWRLSSKILYSLIKSKKNRWKILPRWTNAAQIKPIYNARTVALPLVNVSLSVCNFGFEAHEFQHYVSSCSFHSLSCISNLAIHVF